MESTTATSSHSTVELSEICDRLQHMGFAVSRRIRIYGEEFEVVSNPFPQGNGFAIRGIAKLQTQARIVMLPLPVVQTVKLKKAA